MATTIVKRVFDPGMDSVVDMFQRVAGDSELDQFINGRDLQLLDKCKVDDDPYRYYLLNHTDDRLIIKAVNRTGGRSYTYDSYWDSVRYEFYSEDERLSIGTQLLDWEFKDISDERKRQVLISLGWRGLYTGAKDAEFVLLDIHASLGEFLLCSELRDRIWALIFDSESPLSEGGKQTCINSIISCFEEYPKELQEAVVMQVERYVKCKDASGEWNDRKIRPWLEQAKDQSTRGISDLRAGISPMRKAGSGRRGQVCTLNVGDEGGVQ